MKYQWKYIKQYWIFVLVFMIGVTFGRIAFFSQAKAQTEKVTSNDLEVLHSNIKLFFENLSDSNKGPKKAFEDILKNSPLRSDEKVTNDLMNGLKEINTRFGNYVSFEEIGTKSIGNDLVVIRYLYKCQNYPVVWYFTYYRPLAKTENSSWTLIGFRYDSDLDIALRDSTF
ncbi:MAG: hypothetical protein Q4C95_07510 [Planctomycetia bacterium]|nr:hypothetical protein [Planctomycetia bacterium]